MWLPTSPASSLVQYKTDGGDVVGVVGNDMPKHGVNEQGENLSKLEIQTNQWKVY